MSKEIFKKTYLEKVEANYSYLEPYFNDTLILLSAIKPIKYQIINCLMIEQFIASINCTNHFLERLMKLTLIENYVKGIKYDEAEKLTEKLDIAYEKYDGLLLSQSIKACYEEAKLITENEFIELNKIRELIRNSYSHAQMSKINRGLPKTMSMFMFDFEEVKKSIKNKSEIKKKEVFIPTNSPALQTEFQNSASKDLAINYFKAVYQIAKNIDVKLDFNKEYYK